MVAASFCTPAVAGDVLFENVRIFDGRSAALSAPSNVLVRGNLIDAHFRSPIAAEGATARSTATAGP